MVTGGFFHLQQLEGLKVIRERKGTQSDLQNGCLGASSSDSGLPEPGIAGIFC